jgi:dTDP-4-dehydrorhamnose reductase
MRILVTGRDGQLARSLAERGGADVLLAGRPDLNLAIPGSARSAIRDAKPDLVVNAAAFTAVDLAEKEEAAARRINGDGAGEVSSAAREIGVPVIQISTDYVFDGDATAPYAETAPTNPINAYGRTKLAGEEAVRVANPKHLILRTSWVVSPFGRNFVRSMIDLARDRESLTVVGDQFGSPTFALDLADAILAVAQRWNAGDGTGFGQTFHLAGSGVASWFDVAVAVQDELAALGAKYSSVQPITTADWPTAATRPAYSALDCRKFASTFGRSLPHWRTQLGPLVARLVG